MTKVGTMNLAAAAAAALLASNLAVAMPFSAAAVATISPCPSFCGGSGGLFAFDSDGGEGVLSAFASLNNFDGAGRAQSVFVGASLLPELSAEAFSNAASGAVRSSRVSSQATGMQQYIYSGVSNSLVTLSAVIDGVTSGEAFIEGSLVVARAFNGADVPMSTDFSTLTREILLEDPDLDLLGEAREGVSSGQANLSVPFTVNNGDSIFVWADLIASGTRGGIADAFNTMTLALSDPAGFTPVLTGGVAVPAPQTLMLALLGVLGVSAAGRCRTRC